MVTDPNNPNNNQTQVQPNPIGMGQTPPTNSPNPAQPKGSGRFTNLQKYVGANQGAGQQLGQRIGTQVTNQSDQVRQGIQQAKTGFQQQVDPEKDRIAQGANLVTQAAQDPTQIANDQAKFSQFQQIRDAQTAPIQALTLEQQQQQAAQAQQMAQNAQSEQGRFQLLKGAFGNPRYTTGLGRLDQLFLQASPALNQLQQQSKAVTQGLGGEIQGAQQYSQDQIAQVQSQAQAQQQNLMSTLGREDDPSTPDVDESAGAWGNLSKDMFGRLQTQQQGLDKQYNDILNRIDNVPITQNTSGIMDKATGDLGTRKATNMQEIFNNLTDEDRKVLGLDANMLGFNMSPDEFKNMLRQKQLNNTDRARFINEDEYGKYKSFGELLGQNTQQNLTAEEKALMGKGLGDVSMIAGPQMEQERKAREAALWGGGYLNDMNDLMRGYEVARNNTSDISVSRAEQFRDMPNEVLGPAMGQYMQQMNISPTYYDPWTGRQENRDMSVIGIAQGRSGPLTPEQSAGLGEVVRKAQLNWREGQLIDRASKAGMNQTLGGKSLSADDLYKRYQDFRNKGII